MKIFKIQGLVIIFTCFSFSSFAIVNDYSIDKQRYRSCMFNTTDFYNKLQKFKNGKYNNQIIKILLEKQDSDLSDENKTCKDYINGKNHIFSNKENELKYNSCIEPFISQVNNDVVALIVEHAIYSNHPHLSYEISDLRAHDPYGSVAYIKCQKYMR